VISGRPDTGGQDADMKETIAGKSGTAHAVGAGEVGVESDERRGSSVAEQLIRNPARGCGEFDTYRAPVVVQVLRAAFLAHLARTVA